MRDAHDAKLLLANGNGEIVLLIEKLAVIVGTSCLDRGRGCLVFGALMDGVILVRLVIECGCLILVHIVL